MKCPNCHENLKGNYNFCGYCGIDLKTGEMPIQISFKKNNEKLNNLESVKTYDIQNTTVQENKSTSINKLADEFDWSAPVTIPNKKTPIEDTQTQSKIPEVLLQKLKEFNQDNLAEPIFTTHSDDKYAPNDTADIDDDDFYDVNITASEVKIIDIVGQNKMTAKYMLECLGLKVQMLYKNDEHTPKGIVLSQDIPAGSLLPVGSEIKIIVSVGTWSNWSAEHKSSEKYDVKEKTEYRFRKRTVSTDIKEYNDISLAPDGYTLYDTKKEYSEWETDEYFSNIEHIETELLITDTKSIGFKYYSWSYVSEEFPIENVYCSLQTALYFHPQTLKSDWKYTEIIASDNVDIEYSEFTAVDSSEDTPAGDVTTSNIMLARYNIGGKSYASRCGKSDSEWYKYKKRSIIEEVYSFKKIIISDWDDWSDWSTDIVTADDNTEVEQRKLYKYRRKETI